MTGLKDLTNSSGQIFTDIFNLRCDPDLERSNPIFPQDTLAYNAVLPHQVWLQTDQQFGRYNRNSLILITQVLTVTLTLKIVTNFFLPDTPPRENTLPYQIWLKMVEWFRRYRRDKIGHTDRMTGRQMYRRTDRQSDSNYCVRFTPKVPSYTE